MAGEAAFAVYLGLPEPRLVLDVRPTTSFVNAHVAHSTHIFPLNKLKDRYSSLPPRNVPFLVIGESNQAQYILEAFKGSRLACLLFLDPDVTTGRYAMPVREEVLVCSARSFFQVVDQHCLVRSCKDSRLQKRIDSLDDWPQLLFRPSKAVQRLFEPSVRDDSLHNPRQYARILDLGCGAGRDLAWILYHARRGLLDNRGTQWSGVGVDNWKAALTRAAILLKDPDLNLLHSTTQTETNQQLALLWAKCTDDGFLEPLVGTGKGRAIQHPPTTEEERHALSTFERANLSSLSSNSSVANREECTATYNLILSIRFYPRNVVSRIYKLVEPGGRILISHFTVLSQAEQDSLKQQAMREDEQLVLDYDSPAVQGRLQSGEAEQLVASWSATGEQSWILSDHKLEPIEDGRIIRSVVLKRIA